MEGSASEPAIGSQAFDYKLPANGIGNTGKARTIQFGFTNKDKGTHTSRINQIVKQAGKVPGPGKYVAHTEWKETQTSKFCNSTRDWKAMHKNPSPAQYEAKDFVESRGIGARATTSNHPGIQFGKIQPGKRRGFLDGPIKLGEKTPGPGAHNPPAGCSSTLRTLPRKVTLWDKDKAKSPSLKVKVADIAPNHYQIKYGNAEERMPDYTVSKGKGNNFIDKFVKEKRCGGKELPGPGTYDMQNFDIDKNTSRGTMHLQLRGLSRAPASGYF